MTYQVVRTRDIENIALRQLLSDIFNEREEVVALRLSFYGVESFSAFCEAVESVAQQIVVDALAPTTVDDDDWRRWLKEFKEERG